MRSIRWRLISARTRGTMRNLGSCDHPGSPFEGLLHIDFWCSASTVMRVGRLGSSALQEWWSVLHYISTIALSIEEGEELGVLDLRDSLRFIPARCYQLYMESEETWCTYISHGESRGLLICKCVMCIRGKASLNDWRLYQGYYICDIWLENGSFPYAYLPISDVELTEYEPR